MCGGRWEITVTVTGKEQAGGTRICRSRCSGNRRLAKVWVVAIGNVAPMARLTRRAPWSMAIPWRAREAPLGGFKGALKRHNTYPALKKLHQLIVPVPPARRDDLYLLACSSRMLQQGAGWPDDPLARATRGLRRPSLDAAVGIIPATLMK